MGEGMEITLKDIILLGVGGLIGFSTSLAASLFASPVATFLGGFHIVRILATVRKWFHKTDFDTSWVQVWHVKSSNYPAENSSPLKLYKVWDRVAGTFSVTSNAGITTEFRLLAIDKDGRLTGRWSDSSNGGYFGAFQVCRPPYDASIDGVWCGYSHTEGTVKSGCWTWKKK